MDYNLPDYERLDHRQHFAVGTLVGASALAGLMALDPDASLPKRILVPIAAALLAGAVKEAMDQRDPDNHTCETGDLFSTGLGGVAVSLSFSWSL